MQVWKNHVESSSADFTRSLIYLCDGFPVMWTYCLYLSEF